MALKQALFATDHRAVAKRYFWAGLLFLGIGGFLAMLMRWHWAYPTKALPVVGEITPAGYAALFSNHGIIMVFFAITPLLIGALGTFAIPTLIGARDLAFPRLSALSFWVFFCAQLLALLSMVLPPSPASSGWTMYPPLSTGVSIPGSGMTVMIVAILLSGIATIMGAINYVITVVLARAPGMSWMRLPLTVWGMWLTAILNVLFVPVLVAACALLLCDRAFGTSFFAAQTGDPLLYQHLFWIFGHPEVYILILPVWGIVSDVIASFSQKPAHWYRGTVYAFIAVTALSGLVYGHHLFQAGVAPLFGVVFQLFTLLISVPAVIIAMNWLCTLRGAVLRLSPAMLFALGTVLVFGLGGLTGMPLASITADIHLHDTMWVVGHFHLIMAAATLFGTFAAIYHWFPKLFGRNLSRGLGIAHFAGTLIFALLTFGGLLLGGYAGQLRRLANPRVYEFTGDLSALIVHTSWFAFALGAFQLLFLCNLVLSLLRPPKGDAHAV